MGDYEQRWKGCDKLKTKDRRKRRRRKEKKEGAGEEKEGI